MAPYSNEVTLKSVSPLQDYSVLLLSGNFYKGNTNSNTKKYDHSIYFYTVSYAERHSAKHNAFQKALRKNTKYRKYQSHTEANKNRE